MFQPSEACQDCSKKVPKANLPLHKEMLCTAKHSISIKKQEVRLKILYIKKIIVMIKIFFCVLGEAEELGEETESCG